MKHITVIILFTCFAIASNYMNMSKQELLQVAKKIPANKYAENIRIYQALHRKDLRNKKYIKKIVYYSKKEKQKQEREEKKDILDFATCDKYQAKYNRYLYNYANVAKSMQAKKTSIYMVKSYQDDLIKGCNGVINLSRVFEMRDDVDQGYRIFY